MHRSRRQEQHRKAGKLAAKKIPLVEDKEPEAGRGEQMVKGADAVAPPENVEAQPRRDASADDRGDPTEGRVSPSALAKEEKKGRNGDHSGKSRERSRKESLSKEELQRKSIQTAGRRPARTSARTARIEGGRKARQSRVPPRRSTAVEASTRRRGTVHPRSGESRTWTRERGAGGGWRPGGRENPTRRPEGTPSL